MDSGGGYEYDKRFKNLKCFALSILGLLPRESLYGFLLKVNAVQSKCSYPACLHITFSQYHLPYKEDMQDKESSCH